jgi:hypothetical protein
VSIRFQEHRYQIGAFQGITRKLGILPKINVTTGMHLTRGGRVQSPLMGEERRKRWTWRGVGTSPSEEDKEGGKPGSMVTRSVLIEEVGVVELGLRQPCERGKWGEGVSDESTHGGR